MNVVIITQNEPFYLADNLRYLFSNLPKHSKIVACVVADVSPFGKKESFLQIKNLILPAITLGIRPLSVIIQLCRSSLLEVLGEDYIRTAFAKGLNHYIVIFKHALKNWNINIYGYK